MQCYSEQHAPQKKKYVRINQSPFMNKTLPKATMQKSKLRNLFLNKRTEENRNNYVNPHMHKLSPRGPTHYIFGDQFYSKNGRKLRFHVFLYFYARKHMISSFYPKWTEFTRNCEFHSKYGSRGNQTKLEQNSQFLVNSVHFR